MSTARNPIQPAKPTEEEAIKVLGEHLDDAEAETLARRYLAADETQGHPPDIAEMKRRVLEQKPVR